MFSKLLNKVKQLILNKYVSSAIRHALGLLSGYLIAAGVTQDVALSLTSQLADIAINSLPAVLALVMSWIDKSNSVKVK